MAAVDVHRPRSNQEATALIEQRYSLTWRGCRRSRLTLYRGS
jgi:hypothetical protein